MGLHSFFINLKDIYLTMENFDWTRFTRKINVKASMADLYAAWTTAPEIERWFLSESVFYNSDEQLLPRGKSIEKGCSYAWQWYTYDVTETGRITESNGIDFMQFTFAGDCLVDIRLTQQDNEVIVELTQKNIPTDEKSKINIRIGCHTGWSFFLVNLKSVYEGGIDLRNKDAAQNGMVNS